ncbi:MAG: PQQ-dependent sugar dehydrogenase, partial [Bdellovibrionota bacterium]
MLRLILSLAVSASLLFACERKSTQTTSVVKAESILNGPLESRPDNNSCLAFEKPQLDTAVKLERFTGLDFPEIVGLQQSPFSNRFYAVRRTGLIETFVEGGGKSVFLDFASQINAKPGEGGLLGLAFHPTRKNEFYLSYTVTSSSSPVNLKSVVARFKANDEFTAISQPEVLIELDKPFENHNGGYISFGPDGYLYIAFGDGGSGGDPNNNGQNLGVLAGKILRLDVNNPGAYTIPKDNPFVDKEGARAEIFAYGLRNPWRFQFDRATGDLWAGDVGQDRFEEVNKIQKGGNYGWKVREGFTCFDNNPGCGKVNVIDPIVSYGRDQGASITGGFVYRGNRVPSLKGIYVFGDFVSGNIWGLFPDQNGKLEQKLLLATGFNIPAFGQDAEGEMFVLEYGSGFIHRIVPKTGPIGVTSAPKLLSLTGCFEKADISQPAKGLIPYSVNSPLWSDAAAKRRWMALPNEGKITLSDNGRFEFPNGSVLVKEFALGSKIIETRLFVKHKDGSWAGYTYAWNDDGKDAELVANGLTKKFGDQTWNYPSTAQCLQCHTANAGFVLGLEVSQLNATLGRVGAEWNQMDNLRAIGLFANATPANQTTLPTPSPTIDAGDSARAYLHANCAFCHRPGGTGGGNLDMRYETELKNTGLCNSPGSGNLGIADAKILFPGSPEKSILYQRISRRGAQQMPPLASNLVDEKAQGIVKTWIQNLTQCEASKPAQPASNELLNGDVFSLESKLTGKCVDLDNGNWDNGGRIHQWTCDGGQNQKFRAEEVIEGVFRMRNIKTDKCLDISGISLDNDAYVQQWECGSGLNQQVRLTKTAEGTASISFIHSGKCMDVQSFNMDNAARLIQY